MASRDVPSTRPVIVLDHLTITVTDLERSLRCYDAILGTLGLSRGVEYLDPEDADDVGAEAIGYGCPDGPAILWVVAGALPTTAVHFAFRTAGVDAIEAFVAAAQLAGAAVTSAPRSTRFGRGSAASAIVTDPDGNLVEAFAGPAA